MTNTMNILLINPLVREWSLPNVFPLGLGYIARVCKDKGQNVKVLDLNANRMNSKEFIKEVMSFKPDLVGITGIITNYKEIKIIASYIRSHSNAYIICGGPIASSIDKLLLKKTKVQMCIHGEGEETMKEIIDHYSNISPKLWEIKGTSFILKNEYVKNEPRISIENLNEVKLPEYDLFPIEVYLNAPIAVQNRNKWIDGTANNIEKSLNIVGTRGCPYNCIYCYHNFMGQGYRTRTIDDIINEVKYLKDKYDIKYIHFTDDAFAIIPSFVNEFCDKIKDLDIKWSCAGRVSIAKEHIVSKMKECGCIGLCYGFESASPRILKILNKKATITQYKEAVRLNKKYFDYEDYTFIVGSPTETEESVRESINFCKEVNIVPTAVFFMTPYPETPLFNKLVESGKIDITNLDNYEKYISSLGEQGEKMIMNLTDFSDEVVYNWHKTFLEETRAWNQMKH